MSPVFAADPDQQPEEIVRKTTDEMLNALRTNPERYSEDRQKLMELVDRVLMPTLDFSLTSRLVLGRHWKKASAEQRSTFEDLFRDMLLRTYTTPLLEYANDVEFEFLPSGKQTNPKRTSVRTNLRFSGSEPVPVHYSMRLKDDGWKIYDVVIGGISAVVTFRGSFSEDIKKLGLNEFLMRLGERNEALLKQDAIEAGEK